MVTLNPTDPLVSLQTAQLANPDFRISLETIIHSGALLEEYANGVHGMNTKDSPRFIRRFWEVDVISADWALQQSNVETTTPWGGVEGIVFWEGGQGALRELGQRGWAVLAGGMAWGKPGIAVAQMGNLPVALYTGSIFDNNTAVILPKNPEHLPAIWAFCSSKEFSKSVRRIDQAIKVTNNSLVKVPFDLERWQAVADAAEPLPAPNSNDPTQWLFGGHPVGCTDPLQVALARLLGYHWPKQQNDDLDSYADADGIVCLPSVRGEQPAADRLRALLAAAYGDAWSFALQGELLATTGFGGKGFDIWLRDGFWAQHCARFHQRPFIWHIWDGRRDGFSALVNYHTLDRQKLERLTYTYLNDWLARQRAAMDAMEPGADGRFLAAQQLQERLQAILDGEPPYDIYVRWKPLDKQPIGWEPDLNDGVRMNIRPFVEAGILRGKVNINWKKDRGTNPNGSERHNDLHYTRAEKEAARRTASAGAKS